MRTGLALLAVCATVVTTSASSGRPVDVGTKAKGAQSVVVGVVEEVTARFDVNEFGDRLIVSQTWVRVDETLKGAPVAVVPVDIEGGTIGDLTLNVSDMPALRRGERAVFFLDSDKNGNRKPHGRGQGIVKLDAGGRVQGSNMTLSDVRALVRAALR
jgi:hypothetical protein